LRSPLTAASPTIGFGVLLLVADRLRGEREERAVNWVDVLVIGCAQALALVPGTSRSGITITAGLFRGLSRAAAARFSFLLAVPVMTAAGLAQLAGYSGGGAPVDVTAMVAGAAISALTGIACIHYFLKWLTRFGLWPYVVYRVVLGLTLLALMHGV
jgi:undecaprenyl-diphosphatase